jgi:hypothetical protein
MQMMVMCVGRSTSGEARKWLSSCHDGYALYILGCFTVAGDG